MKASEAKRERELLTMAAAGLPVYQLTRWRWQIAQTLDIWPAVGRWQNDLTGRRGKLNRLTIRELCARELGWIHENAA